MSLFPVSHDGPERHAGANAAEGSASDGLQGSFSSFDPAKFLAQQQQPSSVAQQGLSGWSTCHAPDRRVPLSHVAHLLGVMQKRVTEVKDPHVLQLRSSTGPSTTTCRPAARARRRTMMRTLPRGPHHQSLCQRLPTHRQPAAAQTLMPRTSAARRTGTSTASQTMLYSRALMWSLRHADRHDTDFHRHLKKRKRKQEKHRKERKKPKTDAEKVLVGIALMNHPARS